MDDVPNLLVFESTAFDLREECDEHEIDEDNRLGERLVNHIELRLTQAGADVIDKGVVFEGGWRSEVEIEDRRYLLLCSWLALGKPPRFRWVMQLDLVKPFWRTLFGRNATRQELQPLVTMLREKVMPDDVFQNVRWLTPQEFVDERRGLKSR